MAALRTTKQASQEEDAPMPVPSLLTIFWAYARDEHSVKRPKRRTKALAQRCCAGLAFTRSWDPSPRLNINHQDVGGGYPTATLTA